MPAIEVLTHRPFLKHVVDSCEDGSAYGHDSLLRTAAGLDSVKLRLQVAVLPIQSPPLRQYLESELPYPGFLGPIQTKAIVLCRRKNGAAPG